MTTGDWVTNGAAICAVETFKIQMLPFLILRLAEDTAQIFTTSTIITNTNEAAQASSSWLSKGMPEKL